MDGNRAVDLSGRTFGRWLVAARDNNSEAQHARWLCICACGRIKTVAAASLMSRTSTSCGCGKRPLPPEPPPVAAARWIRLTKGKFALVDERDYVYLSGFLWFFHKGYARRQRAAAEKINGKQGFIHMHHEIIGTPPTNKRVTDHINGDALDNRRQNLRRASVAQNIQNQKLRTDNTSGFKGVYWHAASGGKWCAGIEAFGKDHHLGLFPTAVEAARAYDNAAKRFHGKFARLNFS